MQRMVFDDGSEESDDTPPWKLAIVARADLGMSTGKIAAQVGHAVHQAIVESSKTRMEAWEADGSKIVVLQADSLGELNGLNDEGKRLGIATSVVLDEGLTEVGDGEATTLAVGPQESERVDLVTGGLPLYRDTADDLRVRLRAAEAELVKLRAALPVSAVDPLRPGEVWLAKDLGGELPRPAVPDLFEQWTWEGDQMVLPFKWAQTLQCCCGDAASPCAKRPWEDARFDPQGTFFLTRRSETAGIALACVRRLGEEEIGVVAGLAVQPDFRRRGVGRCLLRLCLGRLQSLGRLCVIAAVDTQQNHEAHQLFTSEGFVPL